MLVEVHGVGISFPDLLLSKGEYQLKPETPFTLGVDFAGTVVEPGRAASSPASGSPASAAYGGAAELVANPAAFTFPLPDAMSYDEGAALPMNYLTAQFALAERGDLARGRDGARARRRRRRRDRDDPGRQGVRRPHDRAWSAPRRRPRWPGPPAPTRWCCSRASRTPSADSPAGSGVDVVVDVVGGDAFTDSLRSLGTQGRLLVVGFAAGQGIPEVKVNRLLLNNVDVRGVGWGAYAMVRPGYMQQQWADAGPDDRVRRRQAADRRDVRPRGLRPGAASTWTSARPSASRSSGSR